VNQTLTNENKETVEILTIKSETLEGKSIVMGENPGQWRLIPSKLFLNFTTDRKIGCKYNIEQKCENKIHQAIPLIKIVMVDLASSENF